MNRQLHHTRQSRYASAPNGIAPLQQFSQSRNVVIGFGLKGLQLIRPKFHPGVGLPGPGGFAIANAHPTTRPQPIDNKARFMETPFICRRLQRQRLPVHPRYFSLPTLSQCQPNEERKKQTNIFDALTIPGSSPTIVRTVAIRIAMLWPGDGTARSTSTRSANRSPSAASPSPRSASPTGPPPSWSSAARRSWPPVATPSCSPATMCTSSASPATSR